MNKKHIVLATLLSISSFAVTAASDTAKLSLHRNNIKVWTYQTENNPIIQYKAETIYDVPLERAVAVVLDVERTPQWVPYVGKAQMLSRDDKKGEFTLYVVIKGKMTKNADGSISIKNNAIQNNYPEQPDVVRLSKYAGDWTFQKLPNNRVKVTTSGYADPAGSIPLSFVNMFVQQQPYQMLMKMKKEVLNPIYAQPKLPDLLK